MQDLQILIENTPILSLEGKEGLINELEKLPSKAQKSLKEILQKEELRRINNQSFFYASLMQQMKNTRFELLKRQEKKELEGITELIDHIV